MVRTLHGALQFIFEDPHARRVEIHGTGPTGEEQAWTMVSEGGGRWVASLDQVPADGGRFDFRYLVDDRFWALDEGIRTIVRDRFGHCRSRFAGS